MSYPSRKRPVRCADCGCLIASLPCLACTQRQAARPASQRSWCEAGHLALGEETGVSGGACPAFELNLTEAQYQRYLKVRRKVEKEIAEGKRTADSDFYD